MAINRFSDYETTKAYGDFTPLPKGGYVMRIMGATAKTNSVGQYVEVEADIAEGEYAGYFKKDYEAQDKEDKIYHCRYFLNVPKDDGSEKDGWSKRRFKTFTAALEESNPGYVFDWDEKKFAGLLIGGLFNEREYEKNDGSVGRATNFKSVTSVEKIRKGDYKLPKDDLLKKKAGTDTGWMDVPEGTDEELPF